MIKYPRAYYVGGFGVGCGVPRVAIIGKPSSDQYRVRVTSRKARAFQHGETFTANYRDLYDKKHFIQGPYVVSQGKAWYVETERLLSVGKLLTD